MLVIAGMALAVLLTACAGHPESKLVVTDHKSLPVATYPGTHAPDFSVQRLDGRPVKLSDFRGRIVVLNIWSFCAPCKAEKPILQQAYQKYRDQGVEILAVETGQSADEVRRFIAGMGLTFTIGLDPDGRVADLYRIRSEPISFFVDAQGVIQSLYPGQLTLKTIDEELGLLLPSENRTAMNRGE